MSRTMVVWCPDWPVVAAGYGPDARVAVVHANRVVACSAAARTEGVRRHLRRREAQARCPDLVVLPADPAAEARAFEAVLAAVEAFTPRVEILRPGACAFATRGPSRYFGGDGALAARIVAALGAIGITARSGIAEGTFAAAIAARTGTIVRSGRAATAAFLAPLPVERLDMPELADLLVRLGITTLGQLAELPAGDVAARFGPMGERAHRLACGRDDRPLAPREPLPERTVAQPLDPPAERVDVAAFAARTLAERLCADLATRGLVTTCVSIEAETEDGESLARLWRHHRPFTPAAIVERVRWQLEGWLAASVDGRTWGGLTLVRITADEVRPDEGRQGGFWGGATAADERAARVMARIQGLLGPDAAVTAVIGGGRSPVDQVRFVPWGDPRQPARPDSAVRGPVVVESPAWPGRLPLPAPAVVHDPPAPVDVIDADGSAVAVSGRGLLTASPVRVASHEVTAWAGPWPVDERWWDPVAHRRAARMQVVLDDGTAHLLSLRAGRWEVDATYD